MKKILLMCSIFTVILFTGFTLERQVSTSLRITVRDDLGNIVENAAVTLYATEDDYLKNENPVVETGYTNQKGEARFKKIEPLSYFVEAKKDDLSNEGGGVQIKELDKGKINKVTIIVQ